MAISVTTPACGKFGFILNATSADASGCEELKAAPGAGTSIIVDHLTINNGANAISITIGEGDTGGAVTTALLGPIAMAVNSSLQWNFRHGMALTAATSLTVDASGAGEFVFSSRARSNNKYTRVRRTACGGRRGNPKGVAGDQVVGVLIHEITATGRGNLPRS